MSVQGQKAINLSREAAQAIEVLNPAIDSLVDGLVESLKIIPIGQSEQILSVHAALSATQKVKTAIIKIIADGQLAEHALMQANILEESK